jgi:hypothetical protein
VYDSLGIWVPRALPTQRWTYLVCWLSDPILKSGTSTPTLPAEKGGEVGSSPHLEELLLDVLVAPAVHGQHHQRQLHLRQLDARTRDFLTGTQSITSADNFSPTSVDLISRTYLERARLVVLAAVLPHQVGQRRLLLVHHQRQRVDQLTQLQPDIQAAQPL